ncbi:MAG TPA: GNAT family N-acetyltransferase [bacterium]|nr:GNAT family N-acetyltransferase [bacterium]
MTPLRFLPVMDPSGAAEVEALARTIWPEHYIPLIGETQVDYMLDRLQGAAAILDQVQHGTAYYLLQDPQGDSLGYLALQALEGSLYLSKLYIRKEDRGKGYASQALGFLKARAREKGITRIFLRVHKRNPSVAIYQKMGFRITGPLVTEIGDGFVMDDHRMELDLR